MAERRLRRLVLRFKGCLGAIAPRQARALELRTGVGLRRSHRRAEVARALRVSMARESQIESAALSALGTAASRGLCGTQRPASASTAFLQVSGGLPLGTHAQPAALLTEPTSSPSKDQRLGGGNLAGAPVPAASAGPPLSLPHPGSSSSTWIYALLAVLGATALLTPLVRRDRARAAPAPLAPQAPPPVPPAAATAATGSPIAAYRRADEHGDPAAATNLGVLLEQQGDFDGALAAYRRADARGDANGAFNLGCLLAERGDQSHALAAFRHADELGDAAGASNLGILLEQQGDLDGALAAYHRADQRGDANGSLNLGFLLAGRGDLAGALAAYRRANESGDRGVAEKARSALVELSRHIPR